MCCTKRKLQWVAPVVLAMLVLIVSGPSAEGAPAATKPSAEAKAGFPYVGEVTGDVVYVRSGPGQNWYPTTKLREKERVEVHDVQFGWLKILPPRGSFCYVDKSFVIREQSGTGVIKGDNVYVRAGSQLPDPKYARNKSFVVMKLSRGAEVKILSEDPDGYYRIAPPKGSFYFISRQYVRKVGAGTLPPGGERRVASLTSGPSKVVEAARPPRRKRPGSETTVVRRSAPAAPVKQPKLLDVWQKKYDLVDTELEAALARRPWREVDFRSLRKRLAPIAEQDQEDVAAALARTRIKHIDDVLERIAILKRINGIAEDMAKTRAPAPVASKPAASAKRWIKPDYVGKLVRSFAFEGRYRIVDRQDGKTLVYLEFPPDCPLDPKQFVDRYVKVRAKSKRYDKNAHRNVVEPADIVVADDELGAPTTNPAGPPAPASPAGKPAAREAPE